MQAEVKKLVEVRELIAAPEFGHDQGLAPLKANRDSLQAPITEETNEDRGGVPKSPFGCPRFRVSLAEPFVI